MSKGTHSDLKVYKGLQYCFQYIVFINKVRYWYWQYVPGCSKLTMLLVDVSLKFQMLITDIC